jgi:hypothetical protein
VSVTVYCCVWVDGHCLQLCDGLTVGDERGSENSTSAICLEMSDSIVLTLGRNSQRSTASCRKRQWQESLLTQAGEQTVCQPVRERTWMCEFQKQENQSNQGNFLGSLQVTGLASPCGWKIMTRSHTQDR